MADVEIGPDGKAREKKVQKMVENKEIGPDGKVRVEKPKKVNPKLSIA